MKKSKNKNWFLFYEKNQKRLDLIFSILFSLMMASLTFSLNQLVTLLIPSYAAPALPLIAFIVSLEAFYAAHHTKQKRMTPFEKEWNLFRISEGAVLFIVLRLFAFLANSQTTIQAFRTQGFLSGVFSFDFIIILIISIIVWLIITITYNDIFFLQMNEKDLAWEKLNEMELARIEARTRITQRIFIVGGIILSAVLLSRNFLPANLTLSTNTRLMVFNLLLYFLCAMIVLSLTNFSVQRARWIWDNTPIDPNILRALFTYGSIFLGITLLITLILPTQYTVGLIDFIRLLINFLFRGINLLLTALFAFFGWLFTLIRNLFPQNQPKPETPSPFEPESWQAPQIPSDFIPNIPAEVTTGGIGNLIFWIVLFVGILVAAIAYFVQNKDAIARLRTFNLREFFHSAFNALRKLFKRIKLNISLPTGERKSLFSRKEKSERKKEKKWNPKTDREKIYAAYFDALDASKEVAGSRTPSQTPHKYVRNIVQNVPDAIENFTELTDAFVEARYTQAPVEHDTISFVNRLTKKLKQIFKRKKIENDIKHH